MQEVGWKLVYQRWEVLGSHAPPYFTFLMCIADPPVQSYVPVCDSAQRSRRPTVHMRGSVGKGLIMEHFFIHCKICLGFVSTEQYTHIHSGWDVYIVFSNNKFAPFPLSPPRLSTLTSLTGVLVILRLIQLLVQVRVVVLPPGRITPSSSNHRSRGGALPVQGIPAAQGDLM